MSRRTKIEEDKSSELIAHCLHVEEHLFLEEDEMLQTEKCYNLWITGWRL